MHGSRQSNKDRELIALSFNKEHKLFTYLDTDFTNDDLLKLERSQMQNYRESKNQERNNISQGSSLDQRDPSSEHEINPTDNINTIDVYEQIDFSIKEDISSKVTSKEHLKKNDSNSFKKLGKGLFDKALGCSQATNDESVIETESFAELTMEMNKQFGKSQTSPL